MKFKQIPAEYFITILDRLTRFEPAYKRYNRVFDDIINKLSIPQIISPDYTPFGDGHSGEKIVEALSKIV